MPLFDLCCNKCNKYAGEYLIRVNEVVCCPDCGTFLTRVVSKANFSLKGEGWAKDGYK